MLSEFTGETEVAKSCAIFVITCLEIPQKKDKGEVSECQKVAVKVLGHFSISESQKTCRKFEEVEFAGTCGPLMQWFHTANLLSIDNHEPNLLRPLLQVSLTALQTLICSLSKQASYLFI